MDLLKFSFHGCRGTGKSVPTVEVALTWTRRFYFPYITTLATVFGIYTEAVFHGRLPGTLIIYTLQNMTRRGQKNGKGYMNGRRTRQNSVSWCPKTEKRVRAL